MKRTVLTLMLAAVVAFPLTATAEAAPYHGKHHKPHKRVIVVKPGHRYRVPPRRYYHYHHHDIADIATFAVLAGVTYAIIDNAFYKQQGKEYVYVEAPPTGSYTVVTTNNASHNYDLGKVVSVLPAGNKRVVVDGVEYRNFNGTWFAPVAGSSAFVVVAAPL